MTYENLNIHRLVIHEIFTRDISGPVPPVFNDQLASLDSETKQKLENRITNAIGNGSQSVLMDIVQSGEGSVFNLLKPLWKDQEISEGELIRTSKEVVQKLASVQNSRNIPGGVIVTFEGTVSANNKKCIGIIKAEKHGGFSLSQQNILRYINDLLLTPQQKLYKIAFLCLSDSPIIDGEINPDNVEVCIFDSNNIKNEGKAASIYFYEGFMGCAFPKTSDVLTKEFFYSTKEFITKQSNLSGEQKVDRMTALYTYLKIDNTATISVSDFANRYLPDAPTRDNYTNYMQSKRIPMNSIRKNMDMLSGKLRRRKVRFTNHVDIYAPVENFNDNIEIIGSTETATNILIKGKICAEA